jgi:hypothetical protein
MTIDELKALSEDELQGELEEMLEQHVRGLTNDDTISGLIAGSNALGWGLDTWDIDKVDISKPGEIKVKLSFNFSGNQEDEKPWCGTAISGTAIATIKSEEEIRIRVEECEKDWPDSEDEEVVDEK